MQRPAAHIETDRFFLRELKLTDATPRYLSWLQDSNVQKWIQTAEGTKKLDELKQYIQTRIDRDEVLFLGIFEQHSELHIGNIKYEPIDLRAGSAVMGILIGDADYRGKRVFEEVLLASAQWIRANLNVSVIYLGVEKENYSAVKAYRNLGFAEVVDSTESDSTALTMVLHV